MKKSAEEKLQELDNKWERDRYRSARYQWSHWVKPSERVPDTSEHSEHAKAHDTLDTVAGYVVLLGIILLIVGLVLNSTGLLYIAIFIILLGIIPLLHHVA